MRDLRLCPLSRWHLALCGLCACIGNIGGDTSESSCPTDPPQRIVLLSSRHYGNAVRDLLALPEAPHLTSAGGNPDALFSGGADRVSSALAFEYQTIARQAAETAIDNLDLGCNGAEDDACARAFIERFASRAFRRPLAEDDINGLFTVFTVGREQDGTFRNGIQLVIEAVLQAPSFLYRSEIGNADGQLSPFEVMTALSFLLRDSIPDDGLWAAAQDGRLATREGVEGEVDRLLADPAVQENVTQILVRWFGAKQITLVQKADAAFTPELAQSMLTETELFLHDLLWQKRGGIADLLTSTSSFVDAPLADFYGVVFPGGEGFVPVTLPENERAGILTHASLLAARADVDETSVVRRGLFLYRDLLCQYVSPPPENAAEIASQIAQTHTTERARAEFRMNDPICGGCHGEFDSFGLAFESYDALGRHRDADASWVTIAPEGAAGQGDGAVALVKHLSASPELAACTVKQLSSYGIGRPLEDKEQCHLDEIEAAFAKSNGSLAELVRAIAVSHLMRARGGAE